MASNHGRLRLFDGRTAQVRNHLVEVSEPFESQSRPNDTRVNRVEGPPTVNASVGRLEVSQPSEAPTPPFSIVTKYIEKETRRDINKTTVR